MMSEATIERIETEWQPSLAIQRVLADEFVMPTYQQVLFSVTRPQIKPLDYHVLVMVPEPRTQRDSGIIVASADLAKREQAGAQIGIIVAVGRNAFGESKDPARPFDIVLFRRYAGMIPMVPGLAGDGKSESGLRLMKDEEVIGIVGRSEA